MTITTKKGLLRCLSICLLSLCIGQASGQNAEPIDSLYFHTPDWFKDAKFGVFVHFGAHGMFKYLHKKSGKGDEVKSFAPELYTQAGDLITLKEKDVEEWTKKISKWGAKYAVLTTKHRPGYALWDTKAHDRNTVKTTPHKVDIVKAWTDGLRKNDVKVGLYFSHYDWGSPSFSAKVDKASKASAQEKEEGWATHIETRDQMMKELVTNYGDIDLIWWDEDWCAKDYKELGSDPLLDTIQKYQPKVVMNNRCRHPWRWHYGTPEKFTPTVSVPPYPWETCDNLYHHEGWGYSKPEGFPEEGRKTKKDVLYTFIDVISNGGNYLLNIGPKWDGSLDKNEEEIMLGFKS